MRAELLELSKHQEPISEYEIGFTIDICGQIVQSHWSATHRPFEGGSAADEHEYNEALSDQNFRTAYQVQYIWQLGLWRIVALFDAILSHWFPELGRDGLKRKIQRLEKLGVAFAPEVRRELGDWINLRNTLSHQPPEAPSFGHQLSHVDLDELAALAKHILALAKPYSAHVSPDV